MSHLIASTDRPTLLQARRDLLSTPVEGSGATTWIVKDPLTLEHFQFSAEEYALLDWLREPTTLAELQRKFQRQFSPQTITPQAIWDFLSRLHASGLVVGSARGQGQELLARRDTDRMRRWMLSWSGLLGIRFPGIDPDAFLTKFHDGFRWLFSPAALVAAAAVVLCALSLIFGHFDEFRDRLPAASALFDWRNLPWMLVAIGTVKVLHELGHAFACKHFGGEVREMGFMLLVFAPCLYCDVSDAWRIPSRWRRIAISSAGVLVELLLASIATIIWWYAQPGVVQLVAMNVMLICTVNTLLINGNPLLRYDGYYILSDLVGVPNLWQRSREALGYFWSEWLLGQPSADDPLLPATQRPWLAVYAAVSKVYMVCMSVAIVWGLAKTLAPYHLQNLAYLVGMTILGSALVTPARSAIELARNPLKRGEVRRGRVAIVASATLAAVVAILAIPVDYKVSAPLVLMPEDASRVYATVEGTLDSMLAAGTKVTKGETIGKLKNTSTEIELARLEGECQSRQMRVDHLAKLRGGDPEANDQLPTAQMALADSRRRLAERRNESQRLTLTAPADGILIPAPRIPEGQSAQNHLAMWSGSLLEPETVGAYVKPGTLTCLVGDPNRLTAVLLVDDVSVKFLKPGQRARLRIDQLPGEVIAGEVIEIARHEAQNSEENGTARADLSPLLAGLIAPGHEGAHYEVRVRFDDLPPALVIGGRGDAKVAAERITLGRSLWRSFAQTFRLPM